MVIRRQLRPIKVLMDMVIAITAKSFLGRLRIHWIMHLMWKKPIVLMFCLVRKPGIKNLWIWIMNTENSQMATLAWMMSVWVLRRRGNQGKVELALSLSLAVFPTIIVTVICLQEHYVPTVLLSLPVANNGVTSLLLLQHGEFQKKVLWRILISSRTWNCV